METLKPRQAADLGMSASGTRTSSSVLRGLHSPRIIHISGAGSGLKPCRA